MSAVDFSRLLEQLFPGQFGAAGKDRLRKALLPFRPDPPPPAADYYLKDPATSFLQGDLLQGMRLPYWNAEQGSYEKKYAPALLLSNSCDLAADENARSITKEVMLAPVINAANFFQKLHAESAKSASTYEQLIKRQEISTLLHLPSPLGSETKYPDGILIELDKVFWFPVTELLELKPVILPRRLGSLSSWAHYLLLVKLSYHMCRPPEEADRPAYS